jgi:hypothetical protein
LPGIADSHSSNPEYMPHRPEPMVASAARIRNPGARTRAGTPG